MMELRWRANKELGDAFELLERGELNPSPVPWTRWKTLARVFYGSDKGGRFIVQKYAGAWNGSWSTIKRFGKLEDAKRYAEVLARMGEL